MKRTRKRSRKKRGGSFFGLHYDESIGFMGGAKKSKSRKSKSKKRTRKGSRKKKGGEIDWCGDKSTCNTWRMCCIAGKGSLQNHTCTATKPC